MWRPRLQKLMTLSTYKAELVALCDTMKFATWIVELLKNIGIKPSAAALIVAETGRRKAMTKHFDVHYFWITDNIKDKTFRLKASSFKDIAG